VLALEPVLALDLAQLVLGPEAPVMLVLVAPQAPLVQGLVVELVPEGLLSQP